MADFIQTSFTHTYNGTEITDKLFYQPQVKGQDIFSPFTFLNTKSKANIYIPNRVAEVLRANTGCGFSAVGNTTMTDKTVTPCRVKLNIEQCIDQFWDTAFENELRAGSDAHNPQGTIVERVFLQTITNAFAYDVPTLAWFGDADDADSFYGICDGFWRLFLNATTSLGYSINMDSTAFESSDAYATDGALGILRQMDANMPNTLRAMGDRVKIYTTGTTVRNLLTTYENVGTDSGLARLENGPRSVSFRGYEIIERPDWDEALASANNPFGSTDLIGSNAILWTIPENLIVGSDIKSLPNVMTWYDMKDEKLYAKANYYQGMNYVHDELIMVGY